MVPYYTHLVSAPCDISLVRSFLSVSLQRSFSLYQLVGIRSNQRRITITDLRWCDMVTLYSCILWILIINMTVQRTGISLWSVTIPLVWHRPEEQAEWPKTASSVSVIINLCHWCRWWGSNPHGVATTRFWVLHVCQFHHTGKKDPFTPTEVIPCEFSRKHISVNESMEY